MQLNSSGGPNAIVSMPDGNFANDWYEFCELFGIVPHIGGVHLAQLRLVKRMAEAVGDANFAHQCQDWQDQGSSALEQHGWAGKYYLLFNELETGKKSNTILANQLDGEWIVHFHGLPGVFQPDRVSITLETLKRTNLAQSGHGAVTFCHPDGVPSESWELGYWTTQGIHPPGTFILAMLYMYNGQKEVGMDLAHRMVRDVVERGWLWDWAVVHDGNMPRIGFDYYQNMVLWSLPAAIGAGSLQAPCAPGGLVDRIILAGNPTPKVPGVYTHF